MGGITVEPLIEPLRRAARALNEPRYEDALRRYAGNGFDQNRAHLLYPPASLG